MGPLWLHVTNTHLFVLSLSLFITPSSLVHELFCSFASLHPLTHTQIYFVSHYLPLNPSTACSPSLSVLLTTITVHQLLYTFRMLSLQRNKTWWAALPQENNLRSDHGEAALLLPPQSWLFSNRLAFRHLDIHSPWQTLLYRATHLSTLLYSLSIEGLAQGLSSAGIRTQHLPISNPMSFL